MTSACSTHTATASISSSNSSLRARRLTDIAESADEEEPPTTEVSTGSPMIFGEVNGKGKNGQGLAVVITAHDSSITDGGPGSPVFLDGDRDHLGSPLTTSFSSDSLEPRRKSTGTSPRPSTTDIYGPYTPYTYIPKEKVRLGPRPHVEPVKRPHTSNEHSNTFPGPDQEIRPVASIPKSVQIPPRKFKEPRTRSLSNESLRSIPDTLTTPQFLSSIPNEPPPSPTLSARSLSPNPPQDGPPILTPEKQRLMKALQLRRKTMMPELKEQARRDEESTQETLGMKESDEAKSIAETDKDDEEDEGEQVISQEVAGPGLNGITEESEETNIVGERSQEDLGKEVGTRGINEQVVEMEIGQDSSDQDRPSRSPEEHQPAESTKVRGEPDSDVDTESDHTEVSIMTDSRPVTMMPVQQPIPSVIKISSRASQSAKPPSPDSTKPTVLKRVDRPGPERTPPNEVPVAETARSVSAPFLKPTRDLTKPPVVARKVNVGGGGGGVAQRIRQLEMLSASKAAAAAGAAAASQGPSRSNSPTPSIPAFSPNRPASVHIPVALRRMSNPSTPMRSTTSPPSASNMSGTTSGHSSGMLPSSLRSVISTPSLPKSIPPPKSSPPPKPSPPPRTSPPPPKMEVSIPSPPKSSPLPKMEIIERNNRPELQVTTQITRDEQGSPQPQPTESAKSKNSPNSFSRRSSIDALSDSLLRRKSVDVGPPSTASSRRQSIDRGLLSRSSSSRDLANLPEDVVSPTSPRPSTTSSKKSKKEKEKERRGSSSSSGSSREKSSRSKSKSPTSPKAPKSPSFLQRMSSSLTNKKPKEEAPVAPAAPVVPIEPVKKSYLLAGWINVQLPDTMLWRRRCLKIDSSGWLFLSLTDDEVGYISPIVRKS